MNSTAARDNKTFETKVANLIAATRHLEIAQILLLRRLTLADPESRKWASLKQLEVVFSVILSKAIERFGLDVLKTARDADFAPLLPKANAEARAEDLRILGEIANQMLGPAALTEAQSTQASFEKLVAIGPARPPPRSARTQPQPKEPPPLFAAQLGPNSANILPPAKLRTLAAEAAAAAETEAGADSAPAQQAESIVVDFDTLFDDTICEYARKIFVLLQISGPSRGIRLPFLVAPEFGACYEAVLRSHVLPKMRASRHIQSLAITYNWAELGGDKLIEIIQASEVNNPVLHNWDTRWGAFRTQKVGGKPVKLKAADNPWLDFNQDATRYNYEPPDESDLQILQDLIRYEAESIAKAWRELTQLYEQEFTPNARQEKAREGAFRDGLMKWADKLPDHVGELFIIKAYFDFPRLDGSYIRRMINNFGRTDTERKRNAPYLSRFAHGLPD